MDPLQFKNAEVLLKHLGIVTPQDIDIEAIAYFCGATIRYEPIAGSAARILGFADKAIITVDNNASIGRKRFSAAHELGHWIKDRGKIAVECDQKSMDWTEDNRERMANRYAADLLLPSYLFRPMADKKPITFSTVKDLADAFRTSMTSTAIRLINYGSFPAMVICYSSTGRRWFFRGSGVPDSLWPVKELAKQSLAYELLYSGMSRGPVDVYASEWIDHPESGRYAVKEDSIKIAPDCVLSLIWWEDETQLLDLDSETQ